MSEPLTKLREALKNNELSAYLMGDNNYRFRDKWAEVPTDLSTVFLDAFNMYVQLNDTNRNELEVKLRDALIELLKNPEGTWWALSIVFSYFFEFKEGVLDFSLDIDELLPIVNSSVKAFKDDLKNNRSWTGWRFDNGLWDDVVFIVSRINDKLKQENAPMLIEIGE